MQNKLKYLLVFVLLALGAWVRTYRLDFPLADWHSWRQADTAAVARNFATDRFDMLYPQSDSLLALNEHGLENPDRLFINEFPLYNASVALIYQQLGVNHVYGRIVSIVVSIVGAFFLYLLVKRLLGFPVAALSLFYYLFLPYNIYYSRVFMPDPIFTSLSIITLYWCVVWASTKKLHHGLLMSLFFILATLVKPYALFIAIPMFYWIIRSWGKRAFLTPSTHLIAVISLVPLALWRYHLYLHPEGSFASTWLLNGGDIRFTGAFFRWIIFDRMNRLIFATGGFVLFVVGLFSSYIKKNSSLFFVWTTAIFLYITVFAKGNVNHDYYQLPLVAPGAVMVALGSFELVKLGKNKLQKVVNSAFVLTLLLLSLAFGWFEVRGFFNINNMPIVNAGAKIDEITPPDALVIAPYMGDPAFLYQTNRSGWPVGGDIESKIKLGADYYVTTSKNEDYARLILSYPVIYENDEFSILKLGENK